MTEVINNGRNVTVTTGRQVAVKRPGLSLATVTAITDPIAADVSNLAVAASSAVSTTLAAGASAGASQVTVNSQSGLEVGMVVVLADIAGQSGETQTITGLPGAGVVDFSPATLVNSYVIGDSLSTSLADVELMKEKIPYPSGGRPSLASKAIGFIAGYKYHPEAYGVAFGDSLAGAANLTAWHNMISDIVTRGRGVIQMPEGDLYLTALAAGSMQSIPSNTHLAMMPGTRILAASGTASNYRLLKTISVSNVIIEGGQVIGLDATQGVPVQILQDCDDIQIINTTVKTSNQTLLSISGNGAGTEPKDIQLRNVILDGARQVGLGVIEVKGLSMIGGVIKNISYPAASPQAGIDVEPNAGQSVEACTFNGVIIHNSGLDGIKIAGDGKRDATEAAINDLSFIGCQVNSSGNYAFNSSNADYINIIGGNYSNSTGRSGISMGATKHSLIDGATVRGVLGSPSLGAIAVAGWDVTVANCKVFDVSGYGITGGSGATFGQGKSIAIKNCTVHNAGDDGIRMREVLNANVIGNEVIYCDQDGINIFDCEQGRVTDNDLYAAKYGTGGDGAIYVHGSKDIKVTNNYIRRKHLLATGTAAAGTSTTLTLESGKRFSFDDAINGYTFEIVGGTGSGQVGTVNDYNGTTGVITFTALATAPDNTSQYEIYTETDSGIVYDINIPSGNSDIWVSKNDVLGGAILLHASAGTNAGDNRT